MVKRRRKPVAIIRAWDEYPHAFVPLEALAQRWCESIDTVRRWVRSGHLPAHRFGRALRVSVDDARTYEQSNRLS